MQRPGIKLPVGRPFTLSKRRLVIVILPMGMGPPTHHKNLLCVKSECEILFRITFCTSVKEKKLRVLLKFIMKE